VKTGTCNVTMDDKNLNVDYNGKTIGFRIGFCLGVAF
jgi:hypothetical protein